MNIVQNEYPFNDRKKVQTILETVLKLQQNKSLTQDDYILSPGTLEQMTYSVAKKGQVSTITLAWEYLGTLRNTMSKKNGSQVTPSEGLYENAASTYAVAGRQDHVVFGILAEMEKEGYKPGRQLLVRLANSIRLHSSVRRLDKAMFTLRNSYESMQNGYGDDTLKPTTSALNTVIVGYCDFGFSSKAMDVYNEFESLECIPDENTYSFLMDSIVMDLSTAIPPRIRYHGRSNHTNAVGKEESSWIQDRVEAADAIFEAATEMDYGSDEKMIHSYVKVLCLNNDLKKAMHLVVEKVEKREKLSLATIGLLAMANANIGNFGTVDDIIVLCKSAGYPTGLPKHIMERIIYLRKAHVQ
jgi:pentatricopeptide repeat protein